VPGALRVLSLNRSVYDYELIDEADGMVYRLEVFIEEGSFHIKAQSMASMLPEVSSGETDGAEHASNSHFDHQL